MDTQLQSISKIFTEKLYRIPDYQRGYAWTEKQLKDFWNDIIQLEDGKNHYIGVLTLEKVPVEKFAKWQDDLWIIDSKSFEPYYIVDGQQRLTTTIILIQTITECIAEQDKLNYSTIEEIRKRYIFDSKDDGISRSYLFGYEKDNPSYEFLKRKIFLENSASGYLSEETIYTHNLIFARDYFKKQLNQLSKLEIEQIFKKVTQNFLFNIYSITSDIDVYVAFETMNNRGKPLSNLELLKNRLIYLSTRFPGDESERNQLRKRINDSWKAVYHFLGKNKERPLKDDAFLMNHFMVYFGQEIESDDDLENMPARRIRMFYRDNYENYLLEKKFSLKNLNECDADGNLKLKIQDVNNYIESLQKSVEIWFGLYNPTLINDKDDDEIILLEKIYRIGFNHFSPVLLSCYLTENNKTVRLKLLKTLERFAFIGLALSKYFVFWDMNMYAIKISKGILTVSEFEKHIHDITEKLLKEKDFLANLTKSFSDGFYSWNGIKYFLFEYEMSLQRMSKTTKTKIDWFEFSREMEDFITVEHIYPQTPKSDCWKSKFNIYTLKQRRILNNNLGNLLPLSKPKNSSLQNKCFAKKIDNGENQIGFKFGSYSENEISHLQDWTPEEILKRGIKLLEFMEKNWNLNLGDNNQKIKILNLEFMEN